MKLKVLVILGPTASGKSDLGVKLAKKFKGEIISADSRQVYKGLDIGTGKITKKEMRGVPHHLLDVADPKEQFSASDFLMLTNPAIAGIVDRDRLPIVVGGTGFYIDALAGNISLPEVGPNPKLRERLEKKSAQALFKMLQKKDPRRAKNIDANNKIRLIRALEIIEVLGKVPFVKHRVSNNKFIYIGIRPDDLEQRIYQRLLKRMSSMIPESKKLIQQKKLSYKRMHELGLEYRYIALYLQGKLNKSDMFNKLNKEIRQYAKRQMTWFKRNKKIRWFKPEEYKDIESYLVKSLRIYK